MLDAGGSARNILSVSTLKLQLESTSKRLLRCQKVVVRDEYCTSRDRYSNTIASGSYVVETSSSSDQ